MRKVLPVRIDDLTVALRARNPWESFDLGLVLARHTGANLFLAFILPYAGFALLVNLFTWGHPTIAVLIVWWLKPLFDRIALHVLAQSVFGATPHWRATLAGLKQIPRTGLLHALTTGRWDFARSFHLAVYQLEGQTGRDRRERLNVLDKKARGHAVWLSIVTIHFVYVLLFGLDGLLKMVSPEGVQFSLRLGDYFNAGEGEPSLLSQYLFNGAYLLAECVLEPLYVAAGFSLYLNRRTALEGWDLEVAFKRMTARIQAQQASMSQSAGVLLIALCSIAVLQGAGSGEAYAQATAGTSVAAPANPDAPPPSAAVTSSASPGAASSPVDAPQAAPTNVLAPVAAGPSSEKKTIQAILAGAEFNQYEERKVWRRKSEPPAPSGSKPPDLSGWIKFAQFMAEVMRVLAWMAAIAFIGWLLYFLSQRLGWFHNLIGRNILYKPDVLFGLDLRAESLPADIPAAARACLAAGDVRGALSLLYRGALRVLIYERDLELRAGDTEGDCVRRVNRAAPGALAQYFARLVDGWGLIAYARRSPADGTAAALIDEWAHYFMTADSSSADRRTRGGDSGDQRGGCDGHAGSRTAPAATPSSPSSTSAATPAADAA